MLHSSEVCGGGPAPALVIASYKEPWTASLWDGLQRFSVQLASAGGSGALAKTAVAPLERVKILLQVQAMSEVPQKDKYRGLIDALKRIPQREGYLALYRGNGANVLRLVPEVGLKFALNDQFRTMFTPSDGRPIGFEGRLAAGAATGILKTALFYPLDLAWTRLAADTAGKTDRRLYTGLLHCISQTYHYEHLRGLYKGVVLSGATVVPYLAVSFAVYDHLKAQLPDDRASRATWWHPLAKIGMGATAGIVAQGVAYPADTVRRRMQLSGSVGQKIVYTGYWDCVRRMAQIEGPSSFYRGIGVSILRTAPAAAIQFVTYDLIKSGIMWYEATSMKRNRR
ncbi:g3133 [Coccomyxa elongata]